MLNLFMEDFMHQIDELMDLIEKLPQKEVNTAKTFIQFLIEKSKKEAISLQGITTGSKVTEKDFDEAKQIWQ